MTDRKVAGMVRGIESIAEEVRARVQGPSPSEASGAHCAECLPDLSGTETPNEFLASSMLHSAEAARMILADGKEGGQCAYRDLRCVQHRAMALAEHVPALRSRLQMAAHLAGTVLRDAGHETFAEKCYHCGELMPMDRLILLSAELRCKKCHEAGAWVPGYGYGDTNDNSEADPK